MSARLDGVPDFDGVAPGIVAFFGWAEAMAKTLGRRLMRSDLPLEAVARWASQMKIIERDAATGDLRVRLFGTGLVDIYGKDLTGKTLRDVLPAKLSELLLGGYEQASQGCVVYENIRFEWGNGRSVAYERLIYPLEKDGTLTQFAAVGYRMRSDLHFLLIRGDIRQVGTDMRVLARIA